MTDGDFRPYFGSDPSLPPGLSEQLERIVDQLRAEVERKILRESLFPPARPSNGELLFADGNWWNPRGLGRGPHVWDEEATDFGHDPSVGPLQATIPEWLPDYDAGFAIDLDILRTGTPSSEECIIHGDDGNEFGVFLTTDNEIRFVVQNTGGTDLDITAPTPLPLDASAYVRCFMGDTWGRAGIIVNGIEYAVAHTAGAAITEGLTDVFNTAGGTKQLTNLNVYHIWLRDIGGGAGSNRSYLMEEATSATSMPDNESGEDGSFSGPLVAGNNVEKSGEWIRLGTE